MQETVPIPKRSASGSSVPAVCVKGVDFSYDGTTVLEGVNLDVDAGNFATVIGPNGGGKTTLIKLILGLLRPQAGEVRVFGQRPRDVTGRIGYAPQHAQYDPKFPVTVSDVVLMGRLHRLGVGRYAHRCKEAVMRALEELRLADLALRPFNALSGGQRQRVLIARALVSDPELLLLDEPTANIDAAAGNRILELLGELNRRMTIIMVSHDFGVVSGMAGSVICVNRDVAIHPTADLTGDTIRELYGGDFRLVRHDHRCPAGGHEHD